MREFVSWLVDYPQYWVVQAVLVASVAGTGMALWWERRRPSSYTRSPEYLGAQKAWRAMSAREQEAHDNAVLDAAEAAESAAARTGSLYR